jgi:hypothetical protein
MSTIERSVEVKPSKPWKTTKRQLVPSASLLLSAVIATYAVVALTPMKGKLAYALLFFIFATAFLASLSWRKRGKSEWGWQMLVRNIISHKTSSAHTRRHQAKVLLFL